MDAADVVIRIGVFVQYAIRVYYWIMIGSVLLSWVRPDPRNPVVRFIRGSTEPVFDFFRRTFPFLVAGAIDFSPIVPILLLELLARVVANLFESLAVSVA